MDWDQLFSCWKGNWDALTSYAWIKIVSGLALIAASELLELHLLLLIVFAALVVVDLLTKWIAISHKRLESNMLDACLWCSICGIKAARESGEISSDKMKHRFLSKISMYLIIVAGGSIVDIAMHILRKPVMFVDLIVWYLAITEMLSIIENLNDAGVEAATKLIQVIKTKTGLGGTRNG